MLDYLIQDNNLWPTFEKWGLTTQDIIFIKELIVGPLKARGDDQWPYEGRSIDKSFLYEVGYIVKVLLWNYSTCIAYM